MLIYVQDINGKPLMPSKRFGLIRHLLSEGKMVVVSHEPFTVRQTYVLKKMYVQPCNLGIDSGTEHVGLSVTTEKKELFSAEVKVRTGEVKGNIETRRENRRNRRSRKKRYREPRFNNRVRNKKKGWLPPTIHQNINTYITLIRRVSTILPIKKIRFEVGNFDTQKMSNLDISGEEYQHGQMEGQRNTRQFVLWRDNYTCAICGKNSFKDKLVMNSHHIVWKTNGGSDRPDNQVCVCKKCHVRIHKHKAELPENLNIKAKTLLRLRDAGLMNAMKERVAEEIRKAFPDILVETTYGYITKTIREKYNIEKSHANDARVISGNPLAEPADVIYMYRQNRRHKRQLQNAAPNTRKDENGKYIMSRKKRREKGYVIRSCREIGEIFGFTKHSLVKYKGKTCIICGLNRKGYFLLRNTKNQKEKYTGVSYKDIKLIRKQYKSLYIEDVKER